MVTQSTFSYNGIGLQVFSSGGNLDSNTLSFNYNGAGIITSLDTNSLSITIIVNCLRVHILPITKLVSTLEVMLLCLQVIIPSLQSRTIKSPITAQLAPLFCTIRAILQHPVHFQIKMYFDTIRS